ncbi:hypothetical protein EI42_01217 [Thermosporothrix hazakensis]|jgi:hypothetical protein|uniref:Acyltransferase-like protein n=2 Tax=Thermosporothrix TaxID=768650 RepID=A0A326UBC5_THEHA|nr:hypothetical protein [Thermosporothrix hazakensis]PZW34380.1 hypothetical protein EI42_01217 [Thermosporothrix hazakensis]BBH85503.1 hypothetical protein KTC_02540 [Thermosporothrix sp. COM3]GCE46070.1 hypothetical protein KTH_09390 [Thermosporothrix hazakensis]
MLLREKKGNPATEPVPGVAPTRLHFIDNIRILLTIPVVLVHLAVTYAMLAL